MLGVFFCLQMNLQSGKYKTLADFMSVFIFDQYLNLKIENEVVMTTILTFLYRVSVVPGVSRMFLDPHFDLTKPEVFAAIFHLSKEENFVQQVSTK